MVEVPPCAAASAESTSARLVCDFEPGTVTVAYTGDRRDGAGHVLIGPSSLVCRLCHHGVMCGRFAVTTDPAAAGRERSRPSTRPTSAGPTAPLAAPELQRRAHHDHRHRGPRHNEPDDEPTRRVRLMRWGLVPPWVKAGPDGAPETKGPLLINARADKVASSPAFRSSAKASAAWCRWTATTNGAPTPIPIGKKARKTPFYLHRGDGEPLFMAGLWSVWKPAKDADTAVELHDHHHRRGRRARRDPRPDAADAGRTRLGRWLDPDAPPDPELAGPSAGHAWHRACARSRRWSTASATTGPSCSSRPKPQAEQMKLL